MFVGVGAGARPRPLRTSQEVRALHRLHRRNRRGRPPARRGTRRRPRRARADTQPAARRDGRLRSETGVILIAATNRPDVSIPRCCARAASIVRSWSIAPTSRAAPRSSRSHAQEQAALQRNLARDARQAHARILRRRPRESAERGRAARGAPEQVGHRDGRLRRGDRPRHRGTGTPFADHLAERKENSPTTSRATPSSAGCTPNSESGPQGHDHLARHGARASRCSCPIEDRHLQTKAESSIRSRGLFGGRVAEELKFREVTTGASNDFEKATETRAPHGDAVRDVERLGPIQYGRGNHQVFLGRDSAKIAIIRKRSRARSTARSARSSTTVTERSQNPRSQLAQGAAHGRVAARA